MAPSPTNSLTIPYTVDPYLILLESINKPCSTTLSFNEASTLPSYLTVNILPITNLFLGYSSYGFTYGLSLTSLSLALTTQFLPILIKHPLSFVSFMYPINIISDFNDSLPSLYNLVLKSPSASLCPYAFLYYIVLPEIAYHYIGFTIDSLNETLIFPFSSIEITLPGTY